MGVAGYSKLRLILPVLALMGVLAWASNNTQHVPDGPDIIGFDKVAHFFVFGLMGTLWFRFFDGELRSGRRFLEAVVVVALCGLADESIQAMNPIRSADPIDWIADVSGALVAIAVYRSWSWYRDLLETPILRLCLRGK